jgi:hypothetical protein
VQAGGEVVLPIPEDHLQSAGWVVATWLA